MAVEPPATGRYEGAAVESAVELEQRTRLVLLVPGWCLEPPSNPLTGVGERLIYHDMSIISYRGRSRCRDFWYFRVLQVVIDCELPQTP